MFPFYDIISYVKSLDWNEQWFNAQFSVEFSRRFITMTLRARAHTHTHTYDLILLSTFLGARCVCSGVTATTLHTRLVTKRLRERENRHLFSRSSVFFTSRFRCVSGVSFPLPSVRLRTRLSFCLSPAFSPCPLLSPSLLFFNFSLVVLGEGGRWGREGTLTSWFLSRQRSRLSGFHSEYATLRARFLASRYTQRVTNDAAKVCVTRIGSELYRVSNYSRCLIDNAYSQFLYTTRVQSSNLRGA